MRTLIINSMFANRLYRRCADELGRIGGVDLTMLTVRSWIMNGREMPMEVVASDAPYKTVIGDTGWTGRENRGFYTSGVREAFDVSRPEAIFLMEEPFSIFTLQLLRQRHAVARNTPVVFFTWNNLSLDEFDYRPSIFYRNVAKWSLPKMQSALTANSDGIDVLRNAGFNRSARVIGYGVDSEHYSTLDHARSQEIRRNLGISDDTFVVGYVGRLLHMKGIDLLTEAFAQVRAKSTRPVKLFLLGSGEYEPELQHQISRLGLTNDIIRVSTVPHADVPLYVGAMDTVILPSRRVGMWAEQFGRVLVESMAAGKVVIGSSSGAIPEVIGDAGFVFEENSVSDLAAKLEQVLALSPQEYEHLAARGTDRARDHYSWSRFAQVAHESLLAAVKEGC